MIRYANTDEGLPARLYRDPAEILRDIRAISSSVEEAESMLNVRGLIVELLTDVSVKDPRKWIPLLRESLEEAEESRATLGKLEESLVDLREELEAARCTMNI